MAAVAKKCYYSNTSKIILSDFYSRILIKCTENPNTIDKNGNTPIHTAANFGHPEIVKILLGCTDAKVMKTKRIWISEIKTILFYKNTTWNDIKEFVKDL